VGELVWADKFGGQEEFIEAMGYEVLLRVEDGYYRGPTRLLLRQEPRYGVVMLTGCPGCYLAATCRTKEQAERLLKQFTAAIKWRRNARSLRDYLTTKGLPWEEGEYTKNEEFLAKAIEILTGIVEGS
jgi:hypothetical protein